MSVRHYGIYVAYPPTVDMRAEGLGRYLAAFLKAAVGRSDIRFVVACPSWSTTGLVELCRSEGVDTKGFDIVSPKSMPAALRLFEAYRVFRKRPRRFAFFGRLAERLQKRARNHRSWLESRIAGVRSFWELGALAAYVGVIAVIGLIPLSVLMAYLAARRAVRKARAKLDRSLLVIHIRARFGRLLSKPEDDSLAFRLYRFMETSESEALIRVINGMSHVSAWYSPTAFWPAFNRITAPRLMCVPDVVLTEFPVAFAQLGSDRFLDVFEDVREAIGGCENFVTYSEHVKWGTLVDRYHAPPDAVRVVHHAPNMLDQWVKVVDFTNAEAASRSYCELLLGSAMQKSTNRGYTSGFANSSMRYIFYASQFRPSKNVLSLLRAYEYLLRKRYIGHKLILTGNPDVLPQISGFIQKHGLEREVLCLRGLSVAELAACYRLADLAVNPSLSEGGCPFTFTEALSVDTPVVMSRIPVTLEVLNDPYLNEVMFFDPYDWKDMALRIEWAIDNRDALLAAQRPVYRGLAQRNWGDVVDEHLAILDAICADALPSVKEA